VAAAVRHSVSEAAGSAPASPEKVDQAADATSPGETALGAVANVLAAAESEPSPGDAAAGKKKKKGFFSKLFSGKGSSAENHPDPDTWTVQLSRVAGTPLGMKIRSDDVANGVVVSDVIADGVVAKCGQIHVGNYIMSINGQTFHNAKHDEVVTALSQEHLTLVISKRGPPAGAAAVAAVKTSAESLSKSPSEAVATTKAAAAEEVEVVKKDAEAAQKAASEEATAAVASVEAAASSASQDAQAAATATSESVQQTASESVAAAGAAAGAAAAPLTGERSVHISKSGAEPLGLSLDGDKGVTITSIAKGSAAAKTDLKVNEKIVSVNGTRVESSSTADVVALLKTAGNEVTIGVVPPAKKERKSGLLGIFSKKSSKATVTEAAAAAGVAATAALESAASASSSLVRKVTLERGTKSLGMKIKSDDVNNYVFVSEIVAGGAAEESKDLAVGDYLVEINGTSMLNAGHEAVVTALQHPVIDLMVVRGSDLQAFLASTQVAAAASDSEPHQIRKVHLVDEGNGFGLATGEENGVVIVSSVTVGGKAEKSGNIFVTDRILEVNGNDVSQLPYAEVDKLIAASKNLELVLAKREQEAAKKSSKRRFSIKLFAEKVLSPLKKKSETTESAIAENATAATAAATAAATSATAAATAAADAVAGDNVRRVRLVRGPTGLGMKIKSDDPQYGVIVYELTSGGVAANSGQVQVGDVILEVNGKSTAALSHEQVVEELRSNSEVYLTLGSGVPAAESNFRTITIPPGAQNVGLNLEAAEPGVKIGSIEPGSRAAEANAFQPGEFITEVNGTSTLTSSVAEVLALLDEGTLNVTVADRFPQTEFEERVVAEDIKTQAQEAVVRTLNQNMADLAMAVEQKERVAEEAAEHTKEELQRRESRVAVAAMEAAEQTRRVDEAVVPTADVLDQKTQVQEQLMHAVSAVDTRQQEEEERTRRVVVDKMHDVQDQLLSVADRKAVAVMEEEERTRRVAEENMHTVQQQLLSEADRKLASDLELEEQARRVAEGVAASPEAVAIRHAAEAELVQKTHVVDAAASSTAAAAVAASSTTAAAAGAAAAAAASSGKRVVVVERGTSSIGLKISGSKGVSVSEVTPGGAAEKAGGIVVGDRIVQINEMSFDASSSYTEVLAALKSAGHTVTIGVESPPPKVDKKAAKEAASSAKKLGSATGLTKSVVLVRGADGLGLRLSTDVVGEVAEVVPGSVAGTAGLVKDDKIVEINGQPLEGKSTDDVVMMLSQEGSFNLLVVPHKKERRSFKQSMKSLFGGSRPSSHVEIKAEPAGPASPAGAAPASEEPKLPVVSEVVAAAAAASGAAGPQLTEGELHKELTSLRHRYAALEMSRSESEQRVQKLSGELNEALEEIARLRTQVKGKQNILVFTFSLNSL
jgi:C-terminal processing protease CtpA/Prc